MSMESTPRFLQGVFPFRGQGLDAPATIGEGVTYAVPRDKRAQLIYLRAGNSSDALVNLVLTRAGQTMRMFPVGARGAVHVPLAVVEDLSPDAIIELLVAAPEGTSGEVVVDLGLIEV